MLASWKGLLFHGSRGADPSSYAIDSTFNHLGLCLAVAATFVFMTSCLSLVELPHTHSLEKHPHTGALITQSAVIFINSCFFVQSLWLAFSIDAVIALTNTFSHFIIWRIVDVDCL